MRTAPRIARDAWARMNPIAPRSPFGEHATRGQCYDKVGGIVARCRHIFVSADDQPWAALCEASGMATKDVSVCLTFDFDAISVWVGPRRSKSPVLIARGEFGAVGARLVDGPERLYAHVLPAR